MEVVLSFGWVALVFWLILRAHGKAALPAKPGQKQRFYGGWNYQPSAVNGDLSVSVMQIVAVTDPLTLGFRRQAMIAIKTDGDLEKVAGQLADMEEIDYVVITAGSFDVLAEVVCEDDDHLLEILGRVRAVPFVTSTETFVYLKLRKQTYSWGTR